MYDYQEQQANPECIQPPEYRVKINHQTRKPISESTKHTPCPEAPTNSSEMEAASSVPNQRAGILAPTHLQFFHITQIEPSLRPTERARDRTFWRRSNVISSRRRDQIPDPDAEATPGMTPFDPSPSVFSSTTSSRARPDAYPNSPPQKRMATPPTTLEGRGSRRGVVPGLRDAAVARRDGEEEAAWRGEVG